MLCRVSRRGEGVKRTPCIPHTSLSFSLSVKMRVGILLTLGAIASCYATEPRLEVEAYPDDAGINHTKAFWGVRA